MKESCFAVPILLTSVGRAFLGGVWSRPTDSSRGSGRESLVRPVITIGYDPLLSLSRRLAGCAGFGSSALSLLLRGMVSSGRFTARRLDCRFVCISIRRLAAMSSPNCRQSLLRAAGNLYRTSDVMYSRNIISSWVCLVESQYWRNFAEVFLMRITISSSPSIAMSITWQWWSHLDRKASCAGVHASFEGIVPLSGLESTIQIVWHDLVTWSWIHWWL